MREKVKNYIEQFNHTLNMPNICWWVIDLKDEPSYFYCNEYMEEVFSLDKTLEKHSIKDTCPIAGEYNKNILDLSEHTNKAKIIFDEYYQLLKLEKENYHNTFPYYNSDLNKLEYFTSRAKVLEKDDNGKVSILYGIIEDVTLQETQKLQLQEAQSIAKIGSWSIDLINDTFSYTNELLNIFEAKSNKELSSYEQIHDTIHKDFIEAVDKAHSQCLVSKEPYEIIYKANISNTKTKWLKEQAKTVFNKYNEPLMMIGTIQDITNEQEYYDQLQKKENQLYQSHKLASMGEMISNIAHQWRQPLSSISTLSSGTLLSMDMEQINNDLIKSNLNSITNITKHMSETIDDFQTFFKPDNDYIEFTMEELMERTLSILNPVLKSKHILVQKDVSANCTIRGPISEYIQILINIISNSKDAFENKKNHDKKIIIKSRKVNEYCTLEIEDNAGGIPKNVIGRVFEPYFTTKHMSQGTGLGLYMSKEIMEKHLNGTIEVKNTKEGCKFIIKIANNLCELK